jgi:heterodisulfide reductase subunit A
MEKCIACGVCAEKCPKKVLNEYDAGLGKRKSVYVKYAQAVPLKYAIDSDTCIFFQKGKCKACEKVCPAGAINFEDQPKQMSINVGAVIMAPGCDVYDPATYDVYGYGKSKNVVTSLEFERILAATGPFEGHLVRPSDHREPEKIAWIQCVGSRDVHPGSQSYCSGVCCTYAIKEATIAKEHQKGALDTAIFYIDLRTHGKDFERYYNRAADAGVRFVKSKVGGITHGDSSGNLILHYIDAAGRKIEEEFDMVVLSVGFSASKEALDLAQKLDIQLDENQHALTSSFEPVKTSRPGIFVCGTFEAPKDIPHSVIEASASAAQVQSALAKSRGSLIKTREIPEEIDVKGDPPRIGVFVCCCGTNIAGFLDVPGVVDYAKTLPGVVVAEKNLFSCSQDTQEKMTEIIKEQKLNRLVVAACTPRTHEPLFQETVVNANINKYLFEMANIRNQCSWVHSDEKDAATKKAKDLVRMAVSRVSLLEPLNDPEISMNNAAMVIGGGLSGITASTNLAEQGYHVYLIEKTAGLGGNALQIHKTWQGEDVQEKLAALISSVESNPNIDVFTDAELKKVDGFVGNFLTTIETGGNEQVLEHGVSIIATGAEELKPDQYLYGQDPGVLTGLELDRRFIDKDPSIKEINSAVFIQCVGSRIEERPYCSKVCCTQSVRNAMKLKEINPDMDVVIVHRDIRTYGLRENLYQEARAKGVIFIRYDFSKDLHVDKDGDRLRIRFTNYALQREMEILPDMLVLATPVIPLKENPMASMFKLQVNDDGFFVEAHAKLRPVEFPTEGIFVAGLAHYPKPIDESIEQAKAAASKASALLSKEKITVDGVVSHVDENYCVGCGMCEEACPYNAIGLVEREGGGKVSRVQAALCKGCGACSAICPTGAASIFHFDDREVMSMVETAFE